jgi:hypothetical protein
MVAYSGLAPLKRILQHLNLGGLALFFLGIPVFLGLLQGATRAGAAQHLPWALGMLFWVSASVGVWACLYGGTRMAAVALKPWRLPLWILLVVGGLIGSLVGRHVIYGLAEALRDQFQLGAAPRPAPPLQLSVPFLLNYFQGWLGVFAAWLVAGLTFDRWIGAPAFGHERKASSLPMPLQGAAPPLGAPQPTADTAAADEFLDRLPKRLGRNILALEAADHYVRVLTDLGEDLVLGRFGDAVAALAALDGVRVHRSFWVRRSAVCSVRPQGKGLLLTLSNGAEIPVSQAYREIAKQAGFNVDA